MKKVDFNKLKSHFYYCWYIYIIAAVSILFLTNYIIDLKVSLKSNEKITIFIGSYAVDSDNLCTDIKNNLDNKQIEINILDYNIDDKYYSMTFNSVASVATDLIIAPLNYITESFIRKNFACIDDFYDNSFFGDNFNYLSFEKQKYGIEIYNSNTNTCYLNKYISYVKEQKEDSYYLFINKETCNMMSLLNKDYKLTSNYAYDTLKYLLRGN